MSKDRKALVTVLVLVILMLSFALLYLNTDLFKKTEVGEVIDNSISQNIRFYREYPSVDIDNIYYYATYDEISDLFTNGTGIIFFGFPACPWCQAYAPVLDEAARENAVEKIYYFNIYDMREENIDEYKRLVELTKDFLNKDENGNLKIFVPDSYYIKDGKIVAHNNSMSMLSGDNVREYFNEDRRKQLKAELIENIKLIVEPVCSDIQQSIYGC